MRRNPVRRISEDVTMAARVVRKLIVIVSTLIVLLFAWIQLKELALGQYLADVRPDSMRRFTLAIYYLCWVAGSTFDTNIQEEAYSIGPEGGRIPVRAFFLVALFAAVAIAFLWSSHNELYFFVVLMLFILTNIIGWRYIAGFIGPLIAASKREYETNKNFYSLERLAIVSHYMRGRWQRWRFLVAFTIVVFGGAVCLSDYARNAAANILCDVIPGLDCNQLKALLPDLVFLSFVIIAESWIWIMRVKARVSLKILNGLSQKYTLKPVQPGGIVQTSP